MSRFKLQLTAGRGTDCHCPVFYRIVHLTQKLSPKYDHAYKELEPNRWPLLFHDEETTKQHFKHVSLIEESDLV